MVLVPNIGDTGKGVVFCLLVSGKGVDIDHNTIGNSVAYN